MMGTADELLDLMFRWMEKREHCAKQLRELARELEDFREKCNGSQCVGNTVSVVGAASLLGAGVATLCTGGLAAPFLFLGAAYTGVGATISLATHLTDLVQSSERTKKGQSIEIESNEIEERIKRLFEQLKVECRAESFNADEDELDQRVMAKILEAIARRNGQKWTVCDSIKQSSGQKPPVNAILVNIFLPAIAGAGVIGVAGILVVFALKASGKKAQPLFAEAGKQIVKKMSTTALKGGAMVVGGAVGLAFALHEAIDSWKIMIKNNHVTEASKSLRDTADALDQKCRTLRNQFGDIKTMMAKRQREHEERLEKERMEKERFPRALQEHRKLKMSGMALGSLFLFLFLFQGSIFCKTDKDMSLSSAEGSIHRKETESHMGLRHEEERQGHQTERTGSELEKGSEWTGSDQEKGSEQSGRESFQRETPFVRAVLLNVHSMNKKKSNISEFITANQVDVFLTTETWLKLDTADDVLRKASPPNFRFFHHVSSERIGHRGVAIQFSPVLHGEQKQFDNKKTFEYVVTILQPEEWEVPILSINIYRPPEKNLTTISNFLKEFQELLDQVPIKYNNIIVTGDINIWVDDDKKTYVKKFKDFLRVNGFGMHPNEPTTFHRSNHTLDLVLFRNVEVSDVKVRDDHISDHKPVQFNFSPVPEDKRKKQDEDRELGSELEKRSECTGSDQEKRSEQSGSDQDKWSECTGSELERWSECTGSDQEKWSECTGSELERLSECTGSDQEKGSEQSGSDQEKWSECTGSELEKRSEQSGSDQEKRSEQSGSDQEKRSEQSGSDQEKWSECTGSELERWSECTGSDQEKGIEQSGSDQEKWSECTGSELERWSECTGSDQEKGSECEFNFRPVPKDKRKKQDEERKRFKKA